MPTYQYACTACEHRFEAVQSFSDASLTVCPACQGSLRKVFSSVGIVFKGSGFYRTDSRAGAVVNGDAKPASTETTRDTPATSTETSSTSSSSNSSSGKSDSGSSSSSAGTPAKTAATS